MSLFDFLQCDMPLPARPEVQHLLFQTRTFGNGMEYFRIDENGSLYIEQYDIEDRSDPNDDVLTVLANTLIKTNLREAPLTFCGLLEFHASYGKTHDGMVEFEADVSSGKVTAIRLVIDHPPKEILAFEKRTALEMIATQTGRHETDYPPAL